MVVRVFMVGSTGVSTDRRAFSSGNAEGELGWELRCPSWRQGFKNELA